MTAKQEKPQILEPLQNVTISEGQSVILRAQISGNPAPEVKWFKNEKPMANLPVHSEDTLHTCKLNDTTANDTAKYSITATNSLGTVKTSCNLVVESE